MEEGDEVQYLFPENVMQYVRDYIHQRFQYKKLPAFALYCFAQF
ncbi:MAG: hypothetical protein JWQ57_2782, partial [Mucilaginibacter sp.]|nr:hypothetical protein [Mucilaginibacter sp.]